MVRLVFGVQAQPVVGVQRLAHSVVDRARYRFAPADMTETTFACEGTSLMLIDPIHRALGTVRRGGEPPDGSERVQLELGGLQQASDRPLVWFDFGFKQMART